MEFSNPVAPISLTVDQDDISLKTNADFRKLLMTPRPAGSKTTHLGAGGLSVPSSERKTKNYDAAADRRKKKQFYAQMKRDEDEKQKELESRYRDRARERREGFNKDYTDTELISTTANYRAVAPNAKLDNIADLRKRVIDESKYLGGDMEHTHLVKGLDFALLDKIRIEMDSKKQQEQDDKNMEHAIEREIADDSKTNSEIGRSVVKYILKNELPKKNELFAPGRMAYQIELDEDEETDVPTTIIRSKADCPEISISDGSLSTNDVVINKLTQIISYLRTNKCYGKKQVRKPNFSVSTSNKKDENMKSENSSKKHIVNENKNDRDIYDDVGDYVPNFERKRDRENRRDRYRNHNYDERKRRNGKERSSYFEKPICDDTEVNLLRKEAERSSKQLMQSVHAKYAKETVLEKEKIKKIEPDSYAECYPGMVEMVDAAGDSDDEIDYMKMDQGSKKGPVGRWDFESQDQYSDYMSTREAMPKAAFQYGRKMQDGRRTRRQAPKDDKKELDREWVKIQNIMNKRSNNSDGYTESKKSKR